MHDIFKSLIADLGADIQFVQEAMAAKVLPHEDYARLVGMHHVLTKYEVRLTDEYTRWSSNQ